MPKIPKLKSFITPDEQLTHEAIISQVKEMKRLADLKVDKEKSKESLKRIMNLANIKAQAQKIAKYEAKRANMLKEYNECINQRADDLPITKSSYRISSSHEALMRITKGNNLLNVVVHNKFRLNTLGFSEWLEVHALASKTTSKSNNQLLKNLRAKFQWVISQAWKLGVLPPPELANFGIPVDDKKRKRSSEILHEVFVKEDIAVDRMHRNLIPPLGVVGRKGMVIREPESGVFFYNGNFDLVFQREEKFHLATTLQLIRLHNEIIRGTLEAEEFFKKLEFTIKARNDANRARKIIQYNLDGMGQRM
ncbi:hypothetical protein Tco_0215752 [Tanacetum coccineum]